MRDIGSDPIVGYVVASRAPDGLMQLVHPQEGARIARNAGARPFEPGDRVRAERTAHGYVVMGPAED